MHEVYKYMYYTLQIFFPKWKEGKNLFPFPKETMLHEVCSYPFPQAIQPQFTPHVRESRNVEAIGIN